MKTEVKGSILTITVDLSAQGAPSASGKTMVIDSSHGNQPIAGTNPTVYIGLNVYRKKQPLH